MPELIALRRITRDVEDDFFPDSNAIEQGLLGSSHPSPGPEVQNRTAHGHSASLQSRRTSIKVTGYRLLVTSTTAIFGIYKAVLSYRGQSIAPTTLELVAVIFIGLGLTWLGYVPEDAPEAFPLMFHVDYAASGCRMITRLALISSICCLAQPRRSSLIVRRGRGQAEQILDGPQREPERESSIAFVTGFEKESSLGNHLRRRFERLTNVELVTLSPEAGNSTADYGHQQESPPQDNTGPVGTGELDIQLDEEDITYQSSTASVERTEIDLLILDLESRVKYTPEAHPDRHTYLNNLGLAYMLRFKKQRNKADAHAAIWNLENSMNIIPTHHPHKALSSINLGIALMYCFEILEDVSDINKAISFLGVAEHITPVNHPDRVFGLIHLGMALTRRFEWLETPGDIDKAISTLEIALDILPTSHPYHALAVSSLGFAYLQRCHFRRDPLDANQAISGLEVAIQIARDTHSDTSFSSINLGIAYMRRFELQGNIGDVDSAIMILSEIASSVSHCHSVRRLALINLGISWTRRFEKLAYPTDINEAIRVLRKVVDTCPKDHPDKAIGLNSLGIAYMRRQLYNLKTGVIRPTTDADQAISTLQHAVLITPDGHPNKPLGSYSLALAYLSRYLMFRDSEDVEAALSGLRPVSEGISCNHGDGTVGSFHHGPWFGCWLTTPEANQNPTDDK